MEKGKYKIKYECWKTDDGNLVEDYFVQRKVETCFGTYWIFCKRVVYAWGDMYKEKISFKKESDAKEFIEKMYQNIPYKPDIII